MAFCMILACFPTSLELQLSTQVKLHFILFHLATLERPRGRLMSNPKMALDVPGDVHGLAM